MDLVRNNTGVSSKNFFLVCVTIAGCVLLLVPVFVVIVRIVHNPEIEVEWSGIATYIAAVAGIFASGGFSKALSERYEQKEGDTDRGRVEEGA